MPTGILYLLLSVCYEYKKNRPFVRLAGFSRFVFTDKDPVSNNGQLHLNQQHSIAMNRTEPSDVSGYIIK